MIGKSSFPAVLRHAIDQTSPAAVQRAFAVTGLYPVDRNAIDRSQLVQPTFSASEDADSKLILHTSMHCTT